MEAGMDFFHTLPRRDLQALCKRNGIRANMTNAAMADALHALPSVDGMDEIGAQLMSPAKSAVKSAVAAAAAEEEQRGSPLPRGRRVSVKSPEVIRLDVEGEEEDDGKRRLLKEIVRTPGVALRSSRRARASAPMGPGTPAPAALSSVRTTRRRAVSKNEGDGEEAGVEALPTPATRRSQRTATASARKAAAAQVEEEKGSEATVKTRQSSRRPAASTTARRTTRRTAVKMMALNQEEEEVVVVVEEEQEGGVLDAAIGSAPICVEKCADPKEEEEVVVVATKQLDDLVGGTQEEKQRNKAVEPEQEEGVFLDSDNRQMIEASVEGIVEQQPVTEESKNELGEEQLSVEQSAPLPSLNGSPILGLVSEGKPVEEEEEDSSVGDGEGFGEWSLDKEMADEIGHVNEEEKEDGEAKEVAIDEVQQAMATADEELGEDDFTGDLLPEFDNAGDFSDAETEVAAASEEDITSPVLEEAQVTIASPAETSPLVTNMLDTVVKFLSISTDIPAPVETIIAAEPPVAIKESKQVSLCIYKDIEEKKSTESETVEVEEEAVQVKAEKQKPVNLHTLSLRKLKTMYKEKLIAAANQVTEGKRLALAELDENVC